MSLILQEETGVRNYYFQAVTVHIQRFPRRQTWDAFAYHVRDQTQWPGRVACANQENKTWVMKTTSLSNLKKELALLPPNEVLSVCLKLVKFKKENKELLSYLLFDANNEPEYIESIKAEIDIQFAEINLNNLYIAKKSIRKILRNANKFIKYSGLKQTEVELLMHFCLKMKSLGRMVKSSNSGRPSPSISDRKSVV